MGYFLQQCRHKEPGEDFYFIGKSDVHMFTMRWLINQIVSDIPHAELPHLQNRSGRIDFPRQWILCFAKLVGWSTCTAPAVSFIYLTPYAGNLVEMK
jgi:hypothetical protein